jgi:ankyrin repeat protein
LFYAAAFGNADTLRILFDKKMDINKTDADGNSLLAIAAKAGNINTLEYLISRLNIEQINGGDFTPLELAVANNQYETAKFLIDNGAKVKSESPIGYDDVLSNACKNGNLELVKLLLNSGYPKDGYTIGLQTACQYNQTEIIKYLISLGFDINAEQNNYSALGTACFYGSFDSVKLLIASGVKINGDDKLQSPLSDACYEDDIEIAKYLIEKGADINFAPENLSDESPLNTAIINGSFDIVKLMVESGAKIDDFSIQCAENAGSANIYNYLKSKQ